MATHRAVLYARISKSTEKSVSIERQLEDGRTLAKLRRWTVVGEFIDDGVSGSKVKPEDRKGWQALMASPIQFDRVIVSRADRLSRKVLDFLNTHKTLEERGAAVAAADGDVDMTTAQGRAFALIGQVFAQYEAEVIAERVTGARAKLLRNSRTPGGRVPYGYRTIPNPGGEGKVVAQDPDTIEWVRGMVERAEKGRTVYSIAKWLTEAGAPLYEAYKGERKRDFWGGTTVERILRHPMLAGMVPHNPGNKTRNRGQDVLRGPDGLPVVRDDLAVMTVAAWRAMVKALDERNSAQARPRALRAKTSAAFSGLIFCAEHDEPVRMWRGTSSGRPAYKCHTCHQTISSFEEFAVEEWLERVGDHVRWSRVVQVHDGGEAVRQEVALRLGELQVEFNDAKGDRIREIAEEMIRLKQTEAEAAAQPTITTYEEAHPTGWFGEDWAAAEDDEERHAILADSLERVLVRRGEPGRQNKAKVLARLTWEWRPGITPGAFEEPGSIQV